MKWRLGGAVVFVLVLGLLTPPVTRGASERVASCERELGSYGSASLRRGGSALELTVPGAAGALLYLPFEHTNDPQRPELSRLEGEWRRFRPTVAFYEGHSAGVGANREESIRRYGEAGLVRFLASSAGTSIRRLEPDPADEIQAVAESFPSDQVQMTYLLLQALYYRERQGLPEARIESEMALLLAGRANPALPRVITTVEELEGAFRRYWNLPHRWSQPPSKWFDPFLSSQQSGGRFTNEVMRASAEFRDRHMYRRLAEAVLAGERVLAVAGEAHVRMQAGALDCALR